MATHELTAPVRRSDGSGPDLTAGGCTAVASCALTVCVLYKRYRRFFVFFYTAHPRLGLHIIASGLRVRPLCVQPLWPLLCTLALESLPVPSLGMSVCSAVSFVGSQVFQG